MTADWLSALGDFVGGLGEFLAGFAACIAVGLAAFQGPKELKRWREQRRAERRMEAAGSVMAAALEAIEALRVATSYPQALSGTDDHNQIEATFRRRWEHAQPALDRLEESMHLALTYLPGRPVELLRDLQRLHHSIWGSQLTECSARLMRSPDIGEWFFRSFGEKPQSELQELEKGILEELGPIARCEDWLAGPRDSYGVQPKE